jgi:hypothetical protein
MENSNVDNGREECSTRDRCSAPLCPMDKDSILNGVWIADEPICGSRAYCNILVIQNQYKVRKKDKQCTTIYTYDMLNRAMMITKAIKGIDPDVLNEQLDDGVCRFKRKRPVMSDELRQGRSDRMRQARKCQSK